MRSARSTQSRARSRYSVTLTASSPEQRPQLIFGIRTERVCSISDITWVLRDSRVGFLTYCGTGKRLPAQARLGAERPLSRTPSPNIRSFLFLLREALAD